MPYREKSAWLSLVAIAVTFTPYFMLVALRVAPGTAVPNLPRLKILAIILFVQVVVMIGGHAWLAIRTPEEAKAPLDERERAILHRATTYGYYALMTMAIMVGCVMPFSAGGWKIIDAMLFGIVLAELLKYAMVVWGFRRQA